MGQEALDLAGVHPLLWERTRARIAAVKEYLALPRPTAADQQRLAAGIGVSVTRFHHLVATWALHRRACMLPETGLMPDPAAKEAELLDNPAFRILYEAIGELGTAAPLSDIREEVERRCRLESLEPPPKSTVERRLHQARLAAPGGSGTHAGAPALVIDHCAVELPVRMKDGSTMLPVVTLAILVPENLIIAHSAALRPPSPQAAAGVLQRAFLQSSESGDLRPVHVARGRTRGWRALERILHESRVSLEGRRAVPVSCGRATLRTVGPKLGQLVLRPNLTHRPAVYGNRSVAAIAPNDLEAAIDQAVAEHNGRLCTAPQTIRFSLVSKYASYFAKRLGESAMRRQEKPQARRRYPSGPTDLRANPQKTTAEARDTTGPAPRPALRPEPCAASRAASRPPARLFEGREAARSRNRRYEPKSLSESQSTSKTREAVRRKLSLLK